MKHPCVGRALTGLAWLALATTASGQVISVRGPVPTAPGSRVFGAADVPHAALSVDLTRYGYIEQEYFVHGKASVYRHGASGPQPIETGIPYTTRIIVRRPKDPSRFSGVVQFEPIHPSQGVTFSWFVLARYLMSRGDIYVAVSDGNADKGWSGSPHYRDETAPVGEQSVTKWFEPGRYEALAMPAEEGVRYDILSQVGRLLRSDAADNPLRGLHVRAMLMSGWSYTGSIQRVFINEGFHERTRLPDGKPVFNGYLIGVSSQWDQPGYLPLYDDEPFVKVGDPRRTLRKIDAPVIEFLTQSEVELNLQHGREAPDSDARVGGHRLYELGGVIHVDSLVDPTRPYEEEPALTQLLQHGYPSRQLPQGPVFSCPLPQSDVPMGAFVRAAMDNLRRWVLDGQPPPREQEPFVRKGDSFVRDSAGNVLGGIRSAEFQVPLARYGRYRGTAYPTCRADKPYPFVFFLRNELSRNELIHRYGSAQRYTALYDAAIDRLVSRRWLLAADALRLKARALRDAARQFQTDAEHH